MRNVEELNDQQIAVKIKKLLWERRCVLHTRVLSDLFDPKETTFLDVERVAKDLVKRGELRASKLGVWLPQNTPEWGERT